MSTSKRAAAKKSPKKPAAKVVKKVARTAKAPKKKSAALARKLVKKSLPVAARARTVAVAVPARSTGCAELCRVCGGVCARDGMHEQHRCRNHVGMSM